MIGEVAAGSPVAELAQQVATIKAAPIAVEHDAVLTAVKAWPGDGGRGARMGRRPSLTAAARVVGLAAGRDEETVLPSNKETGHPVAIAAPRGGCCCHSVRRATTVLMKMSSFLAQATSARLCCFPAAINRL